MSAAGPQGTDITTPRTGTDDAPPRRALSWARRAFSVAAPRPIRPDLGDGSPSIPQDVRSRGPAYWSTGSTLPCGSPGIRTQNPRSKSPMRYPVAPEILAAALPREDSNLCPARVTTGCTRQRAAGECGALGEGVTRPCIPAGAASWPARRDGSTILDQAPGDLPGFRIRPLDCPPRYAWSCRESNPRPAGLRVRPYRQSIPTSAPQQATRGSNPARKALEADLRPARHLWNEMARELNPRGTRPSGRLPDPTAGSVAVPALPSHRRHPWDRTKDPLAFNQVLYRLS